MTLLPKEEYYKSLPRKRSSAGVLVFANGRLLCLETTYKPTFEIPGGVVEQGESPLEAAKRECREELGTDVAVRALLCVDYARGDEVKGDAIHYVFAGEADAARFNPDAREIKALHWLSLEEALPRMSTALARRVAAANAAAKAGGAAYCEEGAPFTPCGGLKD
jgi:8-oxo-dGTP pyrophosphatase MutT (NUDIX family)